MERVVGVRFRAAGKVYFFGPGALAIQKGEDVIVETARGTELGRAVTDIKELSGDRISQPVKNILRVATEEDKRKVEENRRKEKDALRTCREMVDKHKLDMKLVRCEYDFNGKKIMFYFTADGRVDFRELVKDLAAVFHTRIELRQIGVRDETKMLGGMGICGRPLCCTTYLSDFQPVSIKMAKEQGLSLNPAKISGVCGRLMCCLNNEEETYEYLNSRLPAKGDRVTTPEGDEGIAASLNILRQRVAVLVDMGNDEKELREYDAADLSFKPRKKKPVRPRDAKKDKHKADGAEKKPRGKKAAGAEGKVPADA